MICYSNGSKGCRTIPPPRHPPHFLSGVYKDFRRHLEAKGNEARGIRGTVSQIRTLFAGCGFKRIGDISASAASSWLKDQRDAGKIGVSTSNGYLVAVKSFCNWLVQDRRTNESPLTHLSRLNAEVDVRVERRPATPEEFPRLIEAARLGKPFRGISGPDRAKLYVVAVHTGFRASELAVLTPQSLDLDSKLSTITVAAAYSKRRRKDKQPIRFDLAEMLREWLHDRHDAQHLDNHVLSLKGTSEAKLWPGTWYKRAADMLKIDLGAAGIHYKDESGRQFDFHALRHTFISNLTAADVHPKRAQQLARHSDINLTMNRYTHLSLADVAGDLDKLPALPAAGGASDAGDLKATATDDAQKMVAGLVAGSSDIHCKSVRTIESGPTKKTDLLQISRTLQNKSIESDCELLTTAEKSRAGGTRTPNQQIMSLLL